MAMPPPTYTEAPVGVRQGSPESRFSNVARRRGLDATKKYCTVAGRTVRSVGHIIEYGHRWHETCTYLHLHPCIHTYIPVRILILAGGP